MKFRFRHILPLEDAEIELGDLTIVAGRNNTGKTYLAYALYGLLKLWRAWPLEHHSDQAIAHPDWSPGEPADMGRALDWSSLAEAVAREGRAAVRVTPEALVAHRRHLWTLLAGDFVGDQLPNVFQVKPEEFGDARVEVVDDRPLTEADRSLEFVPGSRLVVSYDDDLLEFSGRRGDGSALRPYPWLRGVLLRAYTRFLLAHLPRPFVLTGERLGIALFYRELDFTRNQLVELLQDHHRRSGREDPEAPFLIIDKAASRYALPIKDNITYTRNLPDRNGANGDLARRGLLPGLGALVDGEFTASEGDLRYRSRKGAPRAFDIPLHRASSSARALMDFDFFVRHDARKGQLLIVDEPESHLDVDNQVALARLIARTTAAGVRVLVTTHSDYFIKEINNLIMAGGLPPSNEVRKRAGYGDETWVRPSSVRAYLAEDGRLLPCDVDRYGIEIPLFERAVRRINDRSRTLATALYEEERDG